MKKLVMAMAIALAAVAAQAEEVYIAVDYLFKSGTFNGINATGYFIYSDTLSQSDAVAAFSSEGASYASTIASSEARALTVGIEGGEWYDFAGVSRRSEMYVLCFDQDSNNNYMYVSPAANAEWDAEGEIYTYYFNAGDTSHIPATSASGGYQGAGWYSVSNVPEPTSGLLMLLGVAGLALKRKRAREK